MAIIYTDIISVTFVAQGIIPNFDPEYILFCFTKYGYYFIEFTAEVN